MMCIVIDKLKVKLLTMFTLNHSNLSQHQNLSMPNRLHKQQRLHVTEYQLKMQDVAQLQPFNENRLNNWNDNHIIHRSHLPVPGIVPAANVLETLVQAL